MFRNWEEADRAGLHTKTQWDYLGRLILPDAAPADHFDGKYDTYSLYAESATRLKRVAVATPATDIDLLAAIFTATRSAKRCRDAAARCYDSGTHTFAKANKQKKEKLYGLKDRGIVTAFGLGRIQAVGTVGNLTVYRGEGYCYHSLLRPVGTELPMESPEAVLVEAKPKGRKEPRLKDAILTLERLPESRNGFVRVPFPPRKDTRTCHYCGEDGHIARYCPHAYKNNNDDDYEDWSSY